MINIRLIMQRSFLILLLCGAVFVALPCLPVRADDDYAPDNAGEIYVLVAGWGFEGSEDGEFWNPSGIAVDSDGYVYVADRDNHRIQKFTSNGVFVDKWGWYGPDPGQMRFAAGVTVDGAGNVYVADMENYRVQKFTADGEFVIEWGEEAPPWVREADPVTGAVIWVAPELEDGQFFLPSGIGTDASGYVYVSDEYRIQKFTTQGVFVTEWFIEIFNEKFYPSVMAPDASGNVYVSVTGASVDVAFNHIIYKFDSSGGLVTKWGSEGGLPIGKFSAPGGIAIDSEGNVYISDAGNKRIQKYTPTGAFLTQWGDEDTLSGPSKMAIDADDNVYVIDGVIIKKFAVRGQVSTDPDPDTGDCTYSINPTGESFTKKGGKGTIEVTASRIDCEWKAVSELAWVTIIEGSSGTGYGSVSFSVSPNTARQARSGTLDIAGQEFAVTQDGSVTNSIVCPSSYLLGLRDSRLEVLRGFCDRVLTASAPGRELIGLYYRHGPEVIELLERSPALRRSAAQALEGIAAWLELLRPRRQPVGRLSLPPPLPPAGS